MNDTASSDPIRVFFDLWSLYDRVLDLDYMAHDALYREVSRAVGAHFGDRPFSVLDLGCGSGRHLAPALQPYSIVRYEGHDLSPVAIGHARRNFSVLGCPLQFGEGDLRDPLRKGGEPFDLIFSGFTLHHFTREERAEIFALIRRRLAPGGLFLLVDSMRAENENRELWLDRYCGWIEAEWRDIPVEGLRAIVGHIRECDQPGTLSEHEALGRAAGFEQTQGLQRIRWHTVWAGR